MDNKNMEPEQPTTPITEESQTPSPAPASNVEAPEIVTSTEPAPSKPVAALPEGKHRKRGAWKLLAGLAAVVVVAGALAGGYVYGKHAAAQNKATGAVATASTNLFAVPKGATILEQCMPGLGTQYIMPQDIPQGPVYNVYQGKVTGIQYMLRASSLGTVNSAIGDLKLYSQKYDHVDVMSMPAHAGFPAPHYEVDVMAISHAEQDKITCGSSGSSMHMPGMTGMQGMSGMSN